MVIKKSDLDKMLRAIEEQRQQKIADLESRSRNLWELVTTQNFTVDEVVAESCAPSYTPNSEMISGGRVPVYKEGFPPKLVLKVSPDNQDVPVTTLIFYGFSLVNAGDYISAKIPIFEEERVATGLSGPFIRDKVFYFSRDFNPKEFAIELALLSTDGNVLRRYRAFNYKRFLKK